MDELLALEPVEETLELELITPESEEETLELELITPESEEETLELELITLESEEETLELEPIVLESVDFAGLDTTSSSEVIGTVILELSDSSDLILLSTLEKSNPQFEQ